MNKTESLGFIGLGTAEGGLDCGYWLAEKLIEAGNRVNVYDEDSSLVDKLAAKGGIACSSCKEVAEKSTIVFTMSIETSDVEAILFGKDGVADGVKKGSVVIDMSSISPEATKEFAAKFKELGVQMMDAPVNGGAHRARLPRCTLNVLVGGDVDAFKRVKPFFDILGRIIIHIGPTGSGQACKVATQIVNAVSIQALCEAMVYASKVGCDVAKVREAILMRFIDETLLEVHALRIIQHMYKGFRLTEHQKDLSFALEAARKYGLSLPTTAITEEQFNAVVAEGGGDLDHCALMKIAEKNANHTVQPSRIEEINHGAIVEYGDNNLINLFKLLQLPLDNMFRRS